MGVARHGHISQFKPCSFLVALIVQPPQPYRACLVHAVSTTPLMVFLHKALGSQSYSLTLTK